MQVYYGDLHSHCAVGYGHGSIDDAFRNARMQLNFACVTVHGYWGDLPDGEARLQPLVDYHRAGFERARTQWSHVKDAVEANNQPGEFVTLLGYEWHSLAYGDHNIYFKGSEGEIIPAADLEALCRQLRAYKENGTEAMLIPHHIGYKQGYRGINWNAFTPEFSPFVEIMSMHGASETTEAPRPYLHTMGPCDWQSTYQYGLAQGHITGVIGSTDHHSAHPGSYGHGRLAVWAEALTREAIWEGLQNRRTVALTGDNIAVNFSINDSPLGSVIPYSPTRGIDVSVEGGDDIEYIEVLHNNRVIFRHCPITELALRAEDSFKIHFEVGWAEKGELVDWDVSLEVENGELRSVEPRFRGHEILAPQAAEKTSYAFSQWRLVESNGVHFTTCTWGNPTTSTASTQGICLEVTGNDRTLIRGTVNGQDVSVSVGDLLKGGHSFYLGTFLTPAYYFHRAAHRSAYHADFSFQHQSDGKVRDWYYIRVCQKNGQWAWSSPIWVEASK